MESFKPENNDCGRKPEWKMPKKKNDPRTKLFQAKYSSATSGSNRYGGWDRDGRVRFNELRALIEEARQNPHVPNLEEEALKRVRVRNKLGDKDINPDACNGKKQRKKRSFDDMVDCI